MLMTERVIESAARSQTRVSPFEECVMEDMTAAMILGIFLATIFGTIFTVYFVKIARRLTSLIQVLQREAEWRIRVNYELPPPMPLQEGKFSE